MDIINRLKEALKEVNESYLVEYEEQSFMNIKADSMQRTDKFVVIDEIQEGNYVTSRGLHKRKNARLRIYFAKWCDFQNQAGIGDTPYSQHTEPYASRTRQEIRDEIEAEIVWPFINYLNAGVFNGFTYVTSWPFRYPLPKYDGNDVGIELVITLEIPAIC